MYKSSNSPLSILNIANSARKLSLLLTLAASLRSNDRHATEVMSTGTNNLFQGFDRSYKIILLGAASSGKTSLLIRFVDEVYSSADVYATVGIELKSCTLKVDSQAVRLQIWDTSGQEVFFALTRQYFKGCQGAVVIFDLTNRESLKTVSKYIEYFRTESSDEAQQNIVLVGNKCDIENLEVTKQEVDMIMQQHGISEYYETSASLGTNVDEVFYTAARKAFDI